MSGKKHIILAGTGATGALYFVRTLRAALAAGHAVDLIVSNYGLVTLREETSFGGFGGTFEQWLEAEYGAPIERGDLRLYGYKDQTAPIASGSGPYDGMIVVPCTMKTLAGIAHGFSSNLIERAADVTLKERRPLVLVPREAPYNLIHLENMVQVTRAGAAVLPASPAFYQKPKTFDDLGDFIAARALKLLGVSVELFPAWHGLGEQD